MNEWAESWDEAGEIAAGQNVLVSDDISVLLTDEALESILTLAHMGTATPLMK